MADEPFNRGELRIRESTMAERATSKRRYRPIVRLGIFLVSRSTAVSFVCCMGGAVALLLLPVLAKNAHISENALMPGSANVMLSFSDISKADILMKEVSSANSSVDIRMLIAQHVVDAGAHFSYHRFYPQMENVFHPLNFFSAPDSYTVKEDFSSSRGVSTVGIIRAPRGDGKESIVIVTPCNFRNISQGDVLSLGIAYTVFSLFSRVIWLAKDIVWLAADSQFGEYTAVDSWLRDYHTPSFDVKENTSGGGGSSFVRAGTMAAAIVIKAGADGGEASLKIKAEGSNGQMPNLDLISIVNFLAVHRHGFSIAVEEIDSLLASPLLAFVGKTFEFLGDMAGSLNPQWAFSVSVNDYLHGSAALAKSLCSQALGIPTGSHGAFRNYQVDAITLHFSSHKTFVLTRGGRLLEGVIRSLNNLLEKFHHSFFLYLLSSPGKFVSVGVYTIAFALLVAPLPVIAASFYSLANAALISSSSSSTPDLVFKSGCWFRAARHVFFVHLCGAAMSLLPYITSEVPDYAPHLWVLLHVIVVILSVLQQRRSHVRWTVVKSVAVSATFIGLLMMSVVNHGAAQIEALLLVPMCLLSHPLWADLFSSGRSAVSACRALINLVLGILTFPPVLFLGHYSTFVESLWSSSSATYLCLCIIHIPCWILFIHISLM